MCKERIHKIIGGYTNSIAFIDENRNGYVARLENPNNSTWSLYQHMKINGKDYLVYQKKISGNASLCDEVDENASIDYALYMVEGSTTIFCTELSNEVMLQGAMTNPNFDIDCYSNTEKISYFHFSIYEPLMFLLKLDLKGDSHLSKEYYETMMNMLARRNNDGLVSLRDALKEAGRLDQIIRFLEGIEHDSGLLTNSYPVGTYVDEDGKLRDRTNGYSIVLVAISLRSIIERDMRVPCNTSEFRDLRRYVQHTTDIMLHNYSISLAHRVPQHNSMDEIRAMLVLWDVLMNYGLMYDDEGNPFKWEISKGWKRLTDEEEADDAKIHGEVIVNE